jgi:CheY-like chemotaxis protein
MPRILLVDDDEALRKLLRLNLVKLGHEVSEARNGKEALALQKRQPADVLLTDLIMPEMEGIETVKEFRLTYPSVRIIAMSGGGRVGTADCLKFARALGADGILAKPFSNQMMAEAIVEVLRKPGQVRRGVTPRSGQP